MVGKAKAARAELIRTFATLQEREGEAALLTARRETCQSYSDIIDLHDVGTMQNAMLWASTANTLPAAFWSLAYLLHDSEALKAVQTEVDTLLPRRSLDAVDSDDAELWSREHCAQLRVLDSAINEALRLCTGSMVMREATAPTTLTLASGQTVNIRIGDGVSVYPALTHFDSRVFPNPERYQYDRFLNSPVPTLDGVKVASAFMPFGAGASMCPGRHWAMNEIKMLVALLLQNCDWQLMDGETTVPPVDYSRVGIGVYQPKRDMQVRYRYK
jgi:cytochrome P450